MQQQSKHETVQVVYKPSLKAGGLIRIKPKQNCGRIPR